MKRIDRQFMAMRASTPWRARGTVNDEFWQLLALTSDFYWEEDGRNVCRRLHRSGQSPASHLLRKRLPDHTLRQAGARPLRHYDQHRYREARRQKHPFSQVLFRLRGGGEERILNISGTPAHDRKGRFRGYHCCATDITRQHESEAHLQRFRAAIDTSTDMIYLVDPQSLRFVDINQTACQATGYSREELLSMGPNDITGIPGHQLKERYTRLIEHGRSSRLVHEIERKDGEIGYVEIRSRAAFIDGRWIIIAVSRDISGRRRTEQQSLRLQQMFSALSETNGAILRADSVQSLYENVCNAAIKGGRFIISAIVEPNADHLLRARARAGAPLTDQLPRAPISIRTDTAAGGGISGEAWRTMQPVISNDFLNDPRMNHWRAYAEIYGLQAAAAFPLYQRGTRVALLLFYATEVNAFDPEITRLLVNMADNVSFALDSFASDEDRRQAEQQIRESEARFRSLTNLSSDFYWEQDTKLRFTKYEGHVVGDANRHAVSQAIGHRLRELAFLQADNTSWAALEARQEARKTFRDFEFTFTNDEGTRYHFSLSGEPILDDQDRFLGYRGISRDITEKKNIAEQMRHLATHDSLTGLPNRVMFMELLEQGLRSARRYPEWSFAVLFIDLDRFKLVNDTYGHHAGDRLLSEVAKRLTRPLRDSDVVARLGGDEFVVLLQHLREPAQAERIAGKLLDIFEEPLQVRGNAYEISASIGISMYGKDADDAETLMQHADSAMYLAKDEGRNNAQFYLEEINQRNRERTRLEHYLRGALKNNEFTIHYQAKLRADGREVCGAEALLRWHSPVLGEVPPDRFIPIAEESGLILDIGEWVMREACQQLASSSPGEPPLSLAVNLSARQFSDPDLPRRIRRSLDDSGYPAHQLELEITESTVMQDTDKAIEVMRRIRDMGIGLALDDFGTGYSSLGQLKSYPLDTLKIDRTFTSEFNDSEQDKAIIQAIITMAHTLGLQVVAEGVENTEQLAFLHEQGCDLIQGYLCHRPAPIEALLEFCRDPHC
ncbi:MAG: EAL domain-containing protein [Pseudohongiellaceae bacterium]